MFNAIFMHSRCTLSSQTAVDILCILLRDFICLFAFCPTEVCICGCFSGCGKRASNANLSHPLFALFIHFGCCVLHCSPFVCHVSASGDNLYPYLEQVHLHTNGLLASTCVYLEYVYYYPKVKQVQMRVVNKALQIYISLLAVT